MKKVNRKREISARFQWIADNFFSANRKLYSSQASFFLSYPLILYVPFLFYISLCLQFILIGGKTNTLEFIWESSFLQERSWRREPIKKNMCLTNQFGYFMWLCHGISEGMFWEKWRKEFHCANSYFLHIDTITPSSILWEKQLCLCTFGQWSWYWC